MVLILLLGLAFGIQCQPGRGRTAPRLIVIPPAPFTIAILPDTQHYTKENPASTYFAQTQWIIDHQSEENIRFVIHLGDITEDNTTYQWKIADNAHERLDRAGIPYIVVPGNHDNPNPGYGNRDTSLFNQYFGPERYSGTPYQREARL